MSENNNPLIIGIAGGSGSGKTTIAQEILYRIGKDKIAYLPHDAYYKDIKNFPAAQKREWNFDHPHSLETSLLVTHLKQLKAGQAINLPVYNFATYTRTEDVLPITPHRVIVVEGILIFAEPELRDMIDLKIFVDTDADLRFIRRLQRDINERGRTPQSVINQYLTSVRPMHLEFVESSKRYADVIIPQGGHNLAAMDMVAARIAEMLTS